ncbi:MAG: hypothetical protein H0V87_01350 [Chloroflexi bacterium]|nr:hypothetical protein [Chloroflexota bacterium]
MTTNIDDDDLEIPELTDEFWARAVPNPYARKPGEKTEICLDGAVEYQLRLIPSTRVIGRFTSTLDAWPAIIAAAESGRSPRTLSLDAIGSAGQRWHMAAGPFLIAFARLNNGEPWPHGDPAIRPTRSRAGA